jgi:hypothetical protein
MSKTHYHTSDGEMLSRLQLDQRIRKAKEMKLEHQKNAVGYNFCQKCSEENFENCDWDGLEYGILDCSHIISVKSATESGKSELCYSLDNIQIICRHHHKEFDNNQLKFKK